MTDRYRDRERRDQELIRRSRLYGFHSMSCKLSAHLLCCGSAVDREVSRVVCECACHEVSK